MAVRKKIIAFLSALLFLLVVILVMAFRYRTFDFIQDSLWAEDGPVFFQAAQDLQWSSLFLPYAGYLNVYPRLVALISQGFAIGWLPYVFFCGWLSSFLVIRWAVLLVINEYKYSWWVVSALPLLLLMQPHGGETFLSLTNAQWWLAIALALVCSAPEKFDKGVPGLAMIGLMSVTGPFSILFMPVLLVQAYSTRSFRVLITVLLGALIQIATLFTHPRVAQPLDTNLIDWAINLAAFFGFGPGSIVVILAACIFWGATIVLFFTANRLYKALLMCGALTYVLTMVSMKGIPAALSPIGGGARYFVVPYAMLALATFFYNGKLRRTYVSASVALLVVFLFSHNKVHQAHLDFAEYAKLSKFESITRVQLAPVLPNSEGFYVLVRNNHPSPSETFVPTVDDSGRISIGKAACGGTAGVGVAFDVLLESDGYVEFTWESQDGSGLGSRKVFYRAGLQRLQLAFPKGMSPVNVHVLPRPGMKLADQGNDRIVCF